MLSTIILVALVLALAAAAVLLFFAYIGADQAGRLLAMRDVSPEFARTAAAHVAGGLMRRDRPGDDTERYAVIAGELAEARAALFAIGTMLRHATSDETAGLILRHLDEYAAAQQERRPTGAAIVTRPGS